MAIFKKSKRLTSSDDINMDFGAIREYFENILDVVYVKKTEETGKNAVVHIKQIFNEAGIRTRATREDFKVLLCWAFSRKYALFCEYDSEALGFKALLTGLNTDIMSDKCIEATKDEKAFLCNLGESVLSVNLKEFIRPPITPEAASVRPIGGKGINVENMTGTKSSEEESSVEKSSIEKSSVEKPSEEESSVEESNVEKPNVEKPNETVTKELLRNKKSVALIGAAAVLVIICILFSSYINFANKESGEKFFKLTSESVEYAETRFAIESKEELTKWSVFSEDGERLTLVEDYDRSYITLDPTEEINLENGLPIKYSQYPSIIVFAETKDGNIGWITLNRKGAATPPSDNDGLRSPESLPTNEVKIIGKEEIPDNVHNGDNVELKVGVNGVISPSDIKWAVYNNNSPDTSIDENGILIIGKDERSGTLVVVASKKEDNNNNDIVYITVQFVERNETGSGGGAG